MQNIFHHLVFKGRVEHGNMGCLVCYSEFWWCAACDGVELYAVAWVATS